MKRPKVVRLKHTRQATQRRIEKLIYDCEKFLGFAVYKAMTLINHEKEIRP